MIELINYCFLILSNPALKSLTIVIASVISAKVVDVVFTIIFKRLVSRTETDLDDKVVFLLHRPIFYSIIFVGFITAVKVADLPLYIDFALVGIFKTITIFIWLFVGSKILVISMDWASTRKTNRLLQKTHCLYLII